MDANAAAPPVTIVIFGGAGDLAHRKLLPALYNLHVDGLLPPNSAVVGIGRKDCADEDYRAVRTRRRRAILAAAARRGTLGARLPSMLFFVNLDARRLARSRRSARGSTSSSTNAGCRAIASTTWPCRRRCSCRRCNSWRVRAFVGPADVPAVRPARSSKNRSDTTSTSADAINDAIAAVFDERQIFRIDHYLGKETVQNILVLRFANSFFEPLFNQKYIDHVQITVAEAGGRRHAGRLLRTGGRAARHGAEPPAAAPRARRDGAAALARCRRRPRREARGPPVAAAARAATTVDASTVRGQYAAGRGRRAPGAGLSRAKPAWRPASRTETYVALQVFIDNWRWAGVPFFLRTGKRLPQARERDRRST